jgi:hypothetical protein
MLISFNQYSISHTFLNQFSWSKMELHMSGPVLPQISSILTQAYRKIWQHNIATSCLPYFHPRQGCQQGGYNFQELLPIPELSPEVESISIGHTHSTADIINHLWPPLASLSNATHSMFCLFCPQSIEDGDMAHVYDWFGSSMVKSTGSIS